MNPFPSSSTLACPLTSASFFQSASLRSSCTEATAQSNTATTTLGSPAVSLHASFTPMSAPATAPSAMVPSFTRFHWCEAYLSLKPMSACAPASPFVSWKPSNGRTSPSQTGCTYLLYCTERTLRDVATFSATASVLVFGSKPRTNHWSRPCLRAASMFFGLIGRAAENEVTSMPEKMSSDTSANLPSLMALTDSASSLTRSVPGAYSPSSPPTSLALRQCCSCCTCVVSLISFVHDMLTIASAASRMCDVFISF